MLFPSFLFIILVYNLSIPSKASDCSATDCSLCVTQTFEVACKWCEASSLCSYENGSISCSSTWVDLCVTTGVPSRNPTIHPSTQPSVSPFTPSFSPTKLPSLTPSIAPTFAPTFAPSITPSFSPSFFPSMEQTNNLPSIAPTVPPSIAPSSFSPSMAPSTIPPSIRPSFSPSFSPSMEQTNNLPSIAPTVPPSIAPSSFSPSMAPSTVLPSILPSFSSSTLPTCLLLFSPSTAPSLSPSAVSTCSPTLIVTFSTVEPSTELTCYPSLAPVFLPSNVPSLSPSLLPTSCPSMEPSFSSSFFPSTKLNYLPSSVPTLNPSIVPTFSLTAVPIFNPSVIPTFPPSIAPSFSPSFSSSLEPTYLPSLNPAFTPSIAPLLSISSAIPTYYPSMVLTFSPSNLLSSMPSFCPSMEPTWVAPTFAPSTEPSYIQPSHRPSSEPSAKPSRYYNRAPQLSHRPISPPSQYPSKIRSLSSPIPTVLSESITFVPSTKSFLTVSSNSSSWKDVLFLIGVYSLINSEDIFMELEVRASVGSTFILFGSASPSLEIAQWRSTYRRDVVSRAALIPGDLNRDGWNDLFLCNPIISQCYIFYGTEEGITNVQIGGTIYGTSSSDFFGFSLASAGDMNNDGVNDMIVCALSKKACYVLYGGSSWSERLMISEMTEGYQITGDSSSISLMGLSVAGLGDMNDDGSDDVAISVMTSVSSASNIVYVIYGDGEGKGVLLSEVSNGKGGFQIVGETGYYTGFSISGVGDVNGDGFTDLAIGKVPYPGAQSGAESTIIIFGSSEGGDVILSTSIENDYIGRVLEVEGGGFIVSGIGDINHDGFADVLLTACSNYVGESNAYIVTYPTDMTSPPTLQPSSSPSTVPSARPTPRHSTVSTEINSASPTRYPTSNSPLPTIILSRYASSSPSHFDTKSPTVKPSFRPSLYPSHEFPSSQPSSLPSTFNIQGSGSIKIEGNGGRKIYIIYPPRSPTNKTVLSLPDFTPQRDIIDLKYFPAIQNVNDISFSDDPLTMYFAKNVKLIFSSLRFITPNQIQFIFAPKTDTNADTDTDNTVGMTLLNPLVLVMMIVLVAVLLFICGGVCDKNIFVDLINEAVDERRSIVDETLSKAVVVDCDQRVVSISQSRQSSSVSSLSLKEENLEELISRADLVIANVNNTDGHKGFPAHHHLNTAIFTSKQGHSSSSSSFSSSFSSVDSHLVSRILHENEENKTHFN